jgi:hypothetical protein
MPQNYAPNEFHADYLSHRLTKAKRRWDKIAFYVMASLFVVTWIALFWKKEDASSYLNQFEHLFVQWMFGEPYGRMLFIGLAGLIFLLNISPTLLYYIRKYWFFPKSSMYLQAYLKVQSKEEVRLPRGRNATKTPRAFYVHVPHPVSGKVLPVEVSEDWYLHLNAGNQVHAYYHPSNENVLYLVTSHDRREARIGD